MKKPKFKIIQGPAAHERTLEFPMPRGARDGRIKSGLQYHYFGGTEEEWRHKTRGAGGWRDRDWQRKKAYEAEGLAAAALRVKTDEGWRVDVAPYSWEHTCQVVARVLTSTRVQNRFGYIPKVTIHTGAGRRVARGGRVGSTPWLCLPVWSRTDLVILHEIAHVLTPLWEPHGRLWARTYLELVKWELGADKHKILKEAFRTKRVKFNRRRVAKSDGFFLAE